MKSNKADVLIRYFTPGHEINLCGHATIATIYSLKTKGLLGNKTDFTIETKAGILPIRLKFTSDNGLFITMKQASPQFQEFNGSIRELALSMAINE